jgi:hypothetical protein
VQERERVREKLKRIRETRRAKRIEKETHAKRGRETETERLNCGNKALVSDLACASKREREGGEGRD